MSEKVLYLGMASDIMLPLLLVPNVETLYAIDSFDEAYSDNGTIEGQRNLIRRVLKDGNDSRSGSWSIYADNLWKKLSWRNHYLKTSSVITSDETVIDPVWGEIWRLKFKYDGLDRSLVFFSRDFEEEWPSEIQNITHIIGVGSYCWDVMANPNRNLTNIKNMFNTRTTETYKFSALAFNHRHFEQVQTIKDGKEREGEEVATQTIEKNHGVSNFEKLFDPRFNDGTYGFNKYEQFVPVGDICDPEKNKALTFWELIELENTPCGHCGVNINAKNGEYAPMFSGNTGFLCCKKCHLSYI